MQRRFVLLLHETPDDYPERTHWDLMFESENALITWALPPIVSFSELQKKKIPLESFACQIRRLPDHRLDYLNYEGPVSRNRGTVFQLDAGTFEESAPNGYRVQGILLRGIIRIDHLNKDDSMSALNFKKEP